MTTQFPLSKQAAWTAVAVLWMVAFLYYFDRLLLTSMRDAIRADLKMTDAQFGLLTSSFLWVYGVLGPLGGFIADRFGRRLIILASLITWSVAIWLTGHTHSFSELLGSRILMGISEACFLPSALALISNHHRGSTRSRATGLFNTGLYAGSAAGGIGGWLADRYDWRLGFSSLAAVGVVSAVIAAIFLKDADSPEETPLGNREQVTAYEAMRALLSNRGFWVLVGVFCVVSLANWLAYGWLATYLRERFNLSHGVAGLSATGFIPIGAFVGVIGGGIWSDRWYRQQSRARIWVAATGIALAAPAFYLAGSTNLFPAAIIGLLVFGVGRGFLDANSMPILRQISPEKYSAAGYGLFNSAGCIVGGLTTYGGGALLDAQISLSIVFRDAAIGMALIAIALACLKIRKT